jgi:hypothetical protein
VVVRVMRVEQIKTAAIARVGSQEHPAPVPASPHFAERKVPGSGEQIFGTD